MRNYIALFILGIFLYQNILAQNSLDDLNIVLKHNYENNTLGTYLASEWKIDWLSPAWQSRLSATTIVSNINDAVNPTKTMQFNFPAYSLGNTEGGSSWETHISKCNELYISYDLMYMPGFQFQLGGKLPSAKGGTVSAGKKPTGYDGFTCGLSFNVDGQVRFYLYQADQTDEYGQSVIWGHKYSSSTPFSPSKLTISYSAGKQALCIPGVWHNITYRCVLNSITSSGTANYDGILEAYFDGKLVMQLSKILFRKTTTLGIDCMRMYSFFGGNTDDWRNPIKEWLKIDNVMLYSFKSGVNVPKGNTLSPTTRTVSYWRKMLTQVETIPAAPTNLKATNIGKISFTLQWTDNSNNETGFELYSSSSATGTFSKLATFAGNTTSSLRSSATPNSTYYYKILSYNSKGKSALSPVLTLKTLPLEIPAVPSGLKTTSTPTLEKVNIGWTDNSINETGFYIYKSEGDNKHYIYLSKTAANINIFTDNHIISNINYYKIRAYNADGASEYSNEFLVEFKVDTTSTNPIPVDTTKPIPVDTTKPIPVDTTKPIPVDTTKPIVIRIPKAPSNINVTSIGYDKVTIKWTDNSDNEVGFEIERHGPDSSLNIAYFSANANESVFTDTKLKMNSEYSYIIRSFNKNGFYSAYSNTVTIKTLGLDPPKAPSYLKTTEVTQTSISLVWRDNSNNENAFYLKRYLASDSSNMIIVPLDPNVTSYTDLNLLQGTSYVYSLIATNKAGNSPTSNIIVENTLSESVISRTKDAVKDGLIAYYAFTYDPGLIVQDISGNQAPLDLFTQDPNSVTWYGNNSLEINSGAYYISSEPASKIIDAVKSSNEIAIECWIKPSEPKLFATSRVITISGYNNKIGFALDQSYSYADGNPSFMYNTRLQTSSTNLDGSPEFELNSHMNYINLIQLAYTKDKSNNEKFYLNGQLKSEGMRAGGFDVWEDNFKLCLGNAVGEDLSWNGTFYSVAIYNASINEEKIYENYVKGPCDKLVVYKDDYVINISPNPVVDNVTIEIIPVEDQDIASQEVFSIIDMFGNKYYEEILINPGEYYSKTMNLSNYSKGIYLVQLTSGNSQQSKKFVIH